MGKWSLFEQISNIRSNMKSYNLSFLKKVCAALCIGLIIHSFTQAQCVNNLAIRTYDTTLTSNGFAVFNLSFPQWSPDSGTLISVKLSAMVSSLYGFTLRNADSVATTYVLAVGQQDQFSSPTLAIPYSHIISQSMGNYPLNPGQSVSQAPFNFLSNHISSDSITAVSSFLGSGRVNLNYQSFTFTNLNTVNNAAYYYSAGISNNMTFSVQYLYCRSGIALAAGLTQWSATPDGARNVRLNWAAVNETAGRQYVIQRSSDNRNFTNIATLPATTGGGASDYAYPDELPGNTDSSWYYRLQIHDQGQIYYSSIRQVTLAATGNRLHLYPNPAVDFINLVPDQQTPGDWQVDILSADGRLIQRNSYLQTRSILITFQDKLPAGTYFVRATDLHGHRASSASFVVAGH
jgi:hypothetical protein